MFDYYEARQHINLSSVAFDVIENDKYEFLEKPSRQRIINMILSCYSDCCDASIDNAVLRYRRAIEEQLTSIQDNPIKEDVIKALAESYRNQLILKAVYYPKEKAFKFQLDKDNYNAMLEWRDENNYYDGVPGRFIKAVIEEYARKSLYDREQILLRDLIATLEDCIKTHQLIVVTINGSKQSRYEVRPFCVCSDSGYNYHYLVGMSRKAGTDFNERPVSFRLSRINKVKRSHSRSGKITLEQKKIIEDKLKAGGVQFLLDDAELIQIKLSGQGKKMYDSIAHLRPPFIQCEKGNGTWIMTFSCTQMQIDFYFFKFGAEAEILSPISLRDKFAEKYSIAKNRYIPKL